MSDKDKPFKKPFEPLAPEVKRRLEAKGGGKEPPKSGC
jgi:hypothetical protein